jgi:hypothetical protein
MAGPVLIVELPAEQTLRAEVAALMKACTEGLGEGRCELSSNVDSADGVAVVSLRGRDSLSALIEVGNRRAESRPWRSQELVFKEQDARVERFRTLGFAIATLYRESRLETPTGEARSANKKKGTSSEAGAQSATSRSKGDDAGARLASDDANALGFRAPRRGSTVFPRGWLAAGAISAYDHELPSAFRFGGQVTLGVAPIELPVLLNLSGSYAIGQVPAAEASPPISLSWATLAVGTGGFVTLVRDLQVRVFLQGALVKLEAHATDPDEGQQESQRWLMGGQAGVELVAWASQRWGFALGTQVQQLTGATTIAIHEQPVATVAALSAQLTLSLEFRPFQR